MSLEILEQIATVKAQNEILIAQVKALNKRKLAFAIFMLEFTKDIVGFGISHKIKLTRQKLINNSSYAHVSFFGYFFNFFKDPSFY